MLEQNCLKSSRTMTKTTTFILLQNYAIRGCPHLGFRFKLLFLGSIPYRYIALFNLKFVFWFHLKKLKYMLFTDSLSSGLFKTNGNDFFHFYILIKLWKDVIQPQTSCVKSHVSRKTCIKCLPLWDIFLQTK